MPHIEVEKFEKKKKKPITFEYREANQVQNDKIHNEKNHGNILNSCSLSKNV